MSATETAVGAVVAMVADITAEIARDAEGKEILAKAQQVLAQGAHTEVSFRFAGDEIEIALAIRLDTGDVLRVGSKTLSRRPYGRC
jgi:hypothetical protein